VLGPPGFIHTFKNN